MRLATPRSRRFHFQISTVEDFTKKNLMVFHSLPSLESHCKAGNHSQWLPLFLCCLDQANSRRAMGGS